MLVHLTLEDIFDLYCFDIGKPHNLIVWYQMNGLIDLQALDTLYDVMARKT